MNILFMSLLYHPDEAAAVEKLSRDGMQNQINSYQWALIDGLKQNLSETETVSICNALPVGVYPRHYRRLWLPGGVRDGGFRQLGSLNLPWLKQRTRARRAAQAMEQWIAASPDNRVILVYSLYLPYMQAVAKIRRKYPDVKAVVVVTDLPNELGIASGRTGLLKWLEFRMGNRRTALCQAFDGFILLTAQMAQPLAVENKPIMVMEGLISETAPIAQTNAFALPVDPRPAVLYTGTLNRELGIAQLLAAFENLPQAQLWLCGKGDMQREAEEAAAKCDNIRYFGFVPQQTALLLQANAAALINPRSSQGVFTRYSFPSKTLEYMRSGKPVLCCKLEGIPDEYDPYLRYIAPQNAEGIRHALLELLAMPQTQRQAIGERACAFVLREKNSKAQGSRVVAFLRQL